MPERIAVVGAGSWGTALADLLARKEYDVVLWSYEPDVANAIGARHENPKYLQGVRLADSLQATSSLADACAAPASSCPSVPHSTCAQSWRMPRSICATTRSS